METDRFSEYSSFIEVVRQGNFTKAAERLGVSKSLVSKLVVSLETRLGVKLFERTTRRVRPTEAGLEYYDQILPLLRATDMVDSAIGVHAEKLRGDVKITAPIDLFPGRVSKVVSSLMTTNPGIRIQMKLSDAFEDMSANSLDIAIRISETPLHMDNAKLVGHTDLTLIASKDYILRYGMPESVDSLLQHDLLSYSLRNTGNFWRIMTKDGAEHRVRADGPFVADNGVALLCAVEAGLGIAYIPNFIIDLSSVKDELVEIKGDFDRLRMGIYVIKLPKPYRDRAVDMVFDYLISDEMAEFWRSID